jgi:hypothetical protein
MEIDIMSVLQVGKIWQPLAGALAAKYETLQLPEDASGVLTLRAAPLVAI